MMLGVSIFWVKDMFVIESGSIDWATLRTVSIKEGEIEISGRAFVESRRKAVCLYLQLVARGKGHGIMVCRDDGEFPMDRTIHDPDRIRSQGQMEATLIRPIAHQKLAM